jgi:hypothetical protein
MGCGAVVNQISSGCVGIRNDCIWAALGVTNRVSAGCTGTESVRAADDRQQADWSANFGLPQLLRYP